MIEGLEDGYIATVTKTHHAAIDGVSGAELTVNLLDLQPEPTVARPEPTTRGSPTASRPTPSSSATRCSSLARQPLAAAQGGAPHRRGGAQRAPPQPRARASRRRRRRSARRARRSTRRSRRTASSPSPQMSLDDVKMVKNALGGTVNDVVLALCSGALRRYFDDKGETLDGSLVAMVPISVRTEDQKGAMGNRVSSMLVDARQRHRRSGRAPRTPSATAPRTPRSRRRPSAPTRSPTGPSSPRPRWRRAPPGSTRTRRSPTATARCST